MRAAMHKLRGILQSKASEVLFIVTTQLHSLFMQLK